MKSNLEKIIETEKFSDEEKELKLQNDYCVWMKYDGEEITCQNIFGNCPYQSKEECNHIEYDNSLYNTGRVV